MEDDPIYQFWTSDQITSDLLYDTLGVSKSATLQDIRKAYRKKALAFHPDKHAAKTSTERDEAASHFQRIGFAYAILGDEKKRKTYDSTGSTKESDFADAEEMGWDKYFETLFTRIDRKVLDEDKLKYQGSEDEVADLTRAYTECKGSLSAMLEHIPHATHDDEARLVNVVERLLENGLLKRTKTWTASSKDEKARAKRRKASASQAREAEAAAKELGVWDEFYGNGTKGRRNGESASGEAGLQALILKRQKDRSGALDALADKYASMEGKGKKRSKPEPPELSDADFEALRAKVTSKKAKK